MEFRAGLSLIIPSGSEFPPAVPLTLLVPDLLPPPDAPPALRGVRLPELEKWLARARIARHPAIGADAWLAEVSGVGSPVPHAAIALAGLGGPQDGLWMHADPVNLDVQRDSVVLRDASVLSLAAGEAREFVAALQALFAEDRLEFAAPSPDHWFVRVPGGEAPMTTPLADAIGRDIFGLLPERHGRINWKSAITETQMVLSSHVANESRAERGLPAVNSVWFWGEGAAPDRVQSPFAAVASAQAFPRGLGVLARKPVHPAVDSPAALPAVEGDFLVVIDALTAPIRRGEIDPWRQAAADLDTAWFAALGPLIARFGAVRLVLPGTHDTLVASLVPSSRWRLFRGRKSLAEHA